MLHFLPDPGASHAPQPYAEAVARLASIRHALRLVDPFGGGPASDPADDERIAASWDQAGGAKKRRFDARTERVIAGTAAGLEALLAERDAEREPNPAATRRIAEQIRVGLEDVSRLMLGDATDAQPQACGDLFPIAL